LVGLASAKSVSIVQSGAALTTVEAAKFLAVSREFLVNLLDAGELPFHKVGTHPRVYARDVFACKQRRNVARRKALDDLVAAEVKEGLYDLGPDDSKSGH
jgi:excisionase family DNA binding protein